MTTVRDYARRRQNLMQHIGDGIAIVPSAPIARRNGDVLYRYRPDSDFFYLTGFSEPEAVAVLIPGRGERRISNLLPGTQSGRGDVGWSPRRSRRRGRDLQC